MGQMIDMIISEWWCIWVVIELKDDVLAPLPFPIFDLKLWSCRHLLIFNLLLTSPMKIMLTLFLLSFIFLLNGVDKLNQIKFGINPNSNQIYYRKLRKFYIHSILSNQLIYYYKIKIFIKYLKLDSPNFINNNNK